MDKLITLAAACLISFTFIAMLAAPGLFLSDKGSVLIGGFLGCFVLLVVLKLTSHWSDDD